MTANPYGLPKQVRNANGDVRTVRTAVDYHNLLGRGYSDVEAPKRARTADAKPEPAAKADAAK